MKDKNTKQLPTYDLGGFFTDAAQMGLNALKFAGNNTAQVVGAGRPFDYTGAGRHDFDKADKIASPIYGAASAALPMAANLIVPGSGAVVSLAQQGIGAATQGLQVRAEGGYNTGRVNLNAFVAGAPLLSNFPNHAMGGTMQEPTNSNMLTNFPTGGTHEENPMGGINLGNRGLVEEGETKAPLDKGDYIFSDRLKPKGSNKTFAQLSKSIHNKYKDRENDAAATRAMKADLEKLAKDQEAFKAAKQAKIQGSMDALSNMGEGDMFMHGGKLKPYSKFMFPDGGLIKDAYIQPDQGGISAGTVIGNDKLNTSLDSYISPEYKEISAMLNYSPNKNLQISGGLQNINQYSNPIPTIGLKYKFADGGKLPQYGGETTKTNYIAPNELKDVNKLKAWQAKQGLVPDGIWGEKSQAMYNKKAWEASNPGLDYSGFNVLTGEYSEPKLPTIDINNKPLIPLNNVVDSQGTIGPKGASYTKSEYEGITKALGLNKPVAAVSPTNKPDFTKAEESVSKDLLEGYPAQHADPWIPLAQSAGDIFALAKSQKPVKDIKLAKYNPELLDYSREREMATKQAHMANQIAQANIRRNASSSGQALSNTVANNAANNAALMNVLSQSNQNQENVNKQLLNQAQLTNNATSNLEQELNMKNKAQLAFMQQQALSNIGANTANFGVDQKQYDAQNRTNIILQNLMNQPDFKANLTPELMTEIFKFQQKQTKGK